MFLKLQNLLNSFLGYFSFRQRFLIFSLIFVICIPFPFYWLIQAQNLYINSATIHISYYQKQKNWALLLNNLLQHSLLSFTSEDSKYREELNKKIIYNLSKVIDKKIKSENLMRMWTRISRDDPPDTLIHFQQQERLIEAIIENVDNKNQIHNLNLIQENPLINNTLFLLYDLEIYTVKLFYWSQLIKEQPIKNQNYQRSFYINLLRLQDVLKNIQNDLNSQSKLQSMIKDPLFNQFLIDRNLFVRYVKNLHFLTEQLLDMSNDDFPKEVMHILKDNLLITDSLAAYGIAINQKDLMKHQGIRNLAIFTLIFSLIIVLFYIIYHVLTSHFLELDHHIKAMSRGKFKKCFCSDASDEFGPVGIAFDKMSKSVQLIAGELQHLGRQLGESIKHISQSLAIHEEAVFTHEGKIKEIDDHTQTIASRALILAQTMNELTFSSNQNATTDASEQMLEKMRTILLSLTERANTILQHLNLLKEMLEGNKKLFNFLSKVSNQADLLSLNSSITTSSIINNKQSFEKITHEIRRLAKRTAQSTGHIQKIFLGVFENVTRIYRDTNHFLTELNHSIEGIEAVKNHLVNLSTSIKNQTEEFQNINRIIQYQSQVVSDIKKSINQLAQNASENSTQTHHLSLDMQQLKVASEHLQKVLSLFFHPKQRQKLSRISKNE